ncbi:MAG TPA: peptide deformylase [Gammaproteobacteria bacterium]|nr:peptide deformylase [Gammaproteobacteria bacterium]
MAILEILHFPDERLRRVCSPVEVFDDTLQTLIDDMFETMYAAPGIGLAAIQVNVHKRVLVADISEDRSGAICLINPEILSTEGEEEMDEGCLSVPGFYETVRRAERIRVKALDRKGSPVELETGDLLAVCIQHEIDHLNGKLFVDYISPLKRGRIRKKLEKTKRLENLPETSTGL